MSSEWDFLPADNAHTNLWDDVGLDHDLDFRDVEELGDWYVLLRLLPWEWTERA